MTIDHTHPPTAQPALGTRTWRRHDGVELLGEVQGSGLSRPTYLVRREDGQVLQVSELVHVVLESLEPGVPAEDVAATVSARFDKELSVDLLDHLLTTKIQPLGLVEHRVAAGGALRARPQRRASHRSGPVLPTAKPLLALTLRGTILPARVVQALSSLLAPLFWPPLVLVLLVLGVVANVVVFGRADLTTGFGELLRSPVQLLLIWVVYTLTALFHELGHAAACRYGGGRPGRIGFGVLVIYLAFYTDVTDSYRLPRTSRIRVDLGGLYFNVISIVLFAGLYLGTGAPLWVFTMLVVQFAMIQQLLPIVHLDGYFLLSDLIGVPDLFARIGPVLRSLRPGRAPDPRVAELRPAARWTVVGWVLMTVPMLVLALGWLAWNVPWILREAGAAVQFQAEQLSTAWAASDALVVTLSVIALIMICFPIVGLAVFAARFLASIAGLTLRLSARVSMHGTHPSTRHRSTSPG